jgi:hypothetical protein
MKHAIALLMMVFAASAHAQLIVPKGTKGTLKVNYQYKSDGKVVTSSKDRKSAWRALRVVDITAQYVAEAPQPFSALRKDDPKNKQDIARLQNKVESAHKTMQPTMNDMMKIVEKCNENEDCISREIAAYGNQMDLDTIKTGKAQVAEATQVATAARFQMWTLTSQQGTYSIDEQLTRQVYEMTCTDTQVCKRTETRQGAGSIASPAGTKPGAGVSFLEVDAINKDIMAMLPVPLTQMKYKQVVTTSIPDETGGTTEAVSTPWMLDASKPNAVAIPGELKTVSGTQTYAVKGEEDAGGTITVKWTFTRS